MSKITQLQIDRSAVDHGQVAYSARGSYLTPVVHGDMKRRIKLTVNCLHQIARYLKSCSLWGAGMVSVMLTFSYFPNLSLKKENMSESHSAKILGG